MTAQKILVNEHLKEIGNRIKDIEEIISGVNTVSQRLMQIQANEEAYLHKQMQQYYHQVDIEESIQSHPLSSNDLLGQDDSCSSKSSENIDLKKGLAKNSSPQEKIPKKGAKESFSSSSPNESNRSSSSQGMSLPQSNQMANLH